MCRQWITNALHGVLIIVGSFSLGRTVMGVWENIQFSLPLPLFFFIRHSRAVLPVWWVEAHPSGLSPKVRRVMGQAGGLGGGPRASPLPTPPLVLPQESFEFTFFSFRICCGLFEVCLQVFAGLFLDSWELFVFCSLLYYSFAEKNLKHNPSLPY